jgi:nitrogen-specific signal transduction histidine kinase
MTKSKSAAAQSWLETSDAVIRGLNHEFSNRLSLARLAPQLSAMIETGEHAMLGLADTGGNSEDLLNLLRLYRLMVFESSEPAEPLLVSDVVADAVDLFNHHSTFRDMEVRVIADDTIPPVLMNPGALCRAVLLLLSAAARRLPAAHADRGTVELWFGAETNAVHISARALESDASGASEDPPELPALRYLIRNAEGIVDVAPDRLTMSIGTLVRLRQLEKLR